MPKNRENVYVCQKCGGYTVTIDIDEGTTPFMLGCRASGNERDCDGVAYSSFYARRPAHIPPPAWEWYKPDAAEYAHLSEEMRVSHVDLGGLLIRRRAQ